METITLGAVALVSALIGIFLIYLGFRTHRTSQAQNSRTYKRGRL
jgi:hypothetical protein